MGLLGHYVALMEIMTFVSSCTDLPINDLDWMKVIVNGGLSELCDVIRGLLITRL